MAVFIRDSIAYKWIYKYEKPDLEAIWVQINSIEGKVLICCCYRPPNKVYFWPEFSNALDEVNNDQINNMIILGDLNAYLQNVNGHKLMQMCDAQNLLYLVNEPTWITNTTETILDQIITNSPAFVKKVEVTPSVSTNDHW